VRHWDPVGSIAQSEGTVLAHPSDIAIEVIMIADDVAREVAGCGRMRTSIEPGALLTHPGIRKCREFAELTRESKLGNSTADVGRAGIERYIVHARGRGTGFGGIDEREQGTVRTWRSIKRRRVTTRCPLDC